MRQFWILSNILLLLNPVEERKQKSCFMEVLREVKTQPQKRPTVIFSEEKSNKKLAHIINCFELHLHCSVAPRKVSL